MQIITLVEYQFLGTKENLFYLFVRGHKLQAMLYFVMINGDIVCVCYGEFSMR